MSQYQNQHGAQTGKTDENGNPLNQLDQYGNPVSGGGFTGEAGRQHFGTTGGATDHGHGHGQQHHGVDQTTGHGTHTGGVGEYGREEHHGDKKGVKDKIKEKIPGTEQSRTNTDGAGYGTTGQGAGHGTTGQESVREEHRVDHGDLQHGEKKGVMEKIKEKLPGTGGCTGH